MRIPSKKLLHLCVGLIWTVMPVQAGVAADSPSSNRAALVNGAVITSDDFLWELKRVVRLAQTTTRPNSRLSINRLWKA